MDDRTQTIESGPAAGATPIASGPRLRVLWSAAGSPAAGSVVPLAVRETVVGREPGEGVALPADRCASRRHARVDAGGAVVHVTDLGSRNGTFVDGERIARGEKRRLVEGGVLRVGETLFVLRTAAEEEDGAVPELVG